MPTNQSIQPVLLVALIGTALMIPPLALMAIGMSRSPEISVTVPIEHPDGPSTDWGSPHEREFDFWLGEWDVQNRRLQPDGSWKDTSTSKARIQSIIGGRAVLEQWIGQGGNRLRGFSLRAYDPNLDRWVVVLNWTGGRPSQFGRMEGVYDTDHISIYPPGALESGQKQVERYTFSKATPESCQWDAQRTRDGGANWQMYWIMDFKRRGAPLVSDASNAPIFEVPAQPYCTGPSHRALDGVIGIWAGEIRRLEADGTWRAGEVALRGTSMIEGCGIQIFLDTNWSDGERTQAFQAASFDVRRDAWVVKSVDTAGPGIHTWTGTVADDGRLTLESSDAAPALRIVLTPIVAQTLTREVQRRSDTGEWERIELIEVIRQDESGDVTLGDDDRPSL